MAGRRRKPRPRTIDCPECGARVEWDNERRRYVCHGTRTLDGYAYPVSCGWEGEHGDDGRIRSPDDVAPRIAGALERAAEDGRLSAFERRVHAVYCERAAELAWVEVMAADGWVCDELGLDPRAWRNRVRRARARLEALGYVRRLKVSEVTGRRLRAHLEARKGKGQRLPVVLEVLRAPALATCDHCGAEMPDAHRASRRFCSPTCRKASGRSNPRVEALLEAALAGVPSR